MSVVPERMNSINVLLVQTGCLKTEFDSTYPVHLNGIISQNEYRQSIEKMNRTYAAGKSFTISVFIFLFCLIVGSIFLILEKAIPKHSRPFSLIGMLAFVSAAVAITVAFFITHYKSMTRLRHALAEESQKYSSKSPIPCSWRLGTSKNFYKGYGNHHEEQSHSCCSLLTLVIDIGQPTVQTDQTINRY